MENLNPKCYKNKYKLFQILKLQKENETKNKIFPYKLYPFNIYVYLKHQKYIMHIAENCLQYNIFTTLYSFAWLKKRQWN